MKNKVALTVLISLVCMILIVMGVVKIMNTAPKDEISSSSVEETSSLDTSSEPEPIIPDATLSQNKVFQGDMLTITATALISPTITADFDFQPNFFEFENGHLSFVPISYKQKPGDYNLTVKAENFEKTLTVTVEEYDFEIQNMYIDEEIADNTVNSADADWELYVAMKPVKALSDNELYYTDSFIRPVDGEITTEYGMIRYVNDAPSSSRHSGIDIATSEGTPVVATNSGRVILAQYLQMTGNTVVIEHGFGLKSVYYHMSELNVKVDDMVERGAQIGKVGSTGFSTGPHLHFSMAVNTVWVNPWLFIEDTRNG